MVAWNAVTTDCAALTTKVLPLIGLRNYTNHFLNYTLLLACKQTLFIQEFLICVKQNKKSTLVSPVPRRTQVLLNKGLFLVTSLSLNHLCKVLVSKCNYLVSSVFTTGPFQGSTIQFLALPFVGYSSWALTRIFLSKSWVQWCRLYCHCHCLDLLSSSACIFESPWHVGYLEPQPKLMIPI